MVVQHNMQAINANRQLNVVVGQQAKSTEKLSSGYKINRAADDAAGLSISEKMRRQIRGLGRASTNASDGVSAVQTAEGALNEVHDMLQRMNELANQAANGTNSQTDREAIQSEIDALTTEIDRVSETTKFNETMLLKGSEGKKDVLMNAHDAGLKGALVDGKDGTAIFAMKLTAGETVNIGGKDYKLIEDDGKVSTNASEIARGIMDLSNRDKVFVEEGDAHRAYEVIESNLGQVMNQLEFNAVGVAYRFSNNTEIDNSNRIDTHGNTVDITYLDEEGTEQVYRMQAVAPDTSSSGITSTQWQKVTGYNEKTGEANLGGINLYQGNGAANNYMPTDDELLNVLRSAKKIVATQASSGETITFAGKDEIAKEISEAHAGSTIYMSKEPGDGSQTNAEISSVYNAASANGGFNGTVLASGHLGEGKTIKESSDAIERDNGTITVHDAKKLIAKELKAANEIGVDDASEVAAVSKKSGSDIAWSLAIGHKDNVTIKSPDRNGDDRETKYAVRSVLTAEMLPRETIPNNLYKVSMMDGSNRTSGTTDGGMLSTPTSIDHNARAQIRDADGNITELKAERVNGETTWIRVDNDATLTESDLKEIMKTAEAIDYTKDSSLPESASNPTARWRTVEGMRQDIAKLNAGDKVKVEKSTWNYDTGDVEVEEDAGATSHFDMRIGTAEVDKALNFNLHVGADADLNNKIGVGIETMNSKYLGISGLDVVGKDKDGNNINDGGLAATYAIDAIEDAIQKVNDQRSALGAVQNRLEHTINNLDNVVENTTAAESRIRDTDIADEMVKYSKNNILAQAGQSMLAQANQSTQGALSLLGG